MSTDPSIVSEPVLTVENVWKSFGRVQALKDVSLEMYNGDVLALLGDNGAGKSTLIKIIAGNHHADKGLIYLNGKRVVFSNPAEARHAGIETVYQQSPVCVQASVRANFFIGRELCINVPGVQLLRKRAMQRETEEVLNTLGIRVPSVRDKIGLLSGGERQAIILGRFLHWGGKVALLDEPFAALGVGESRKAIKLVQQISERTGVPMIVITHNVEYAFEVANRFIVLRHGEVVGTGRTDEVTVDDIVSMITGAIHVRGANAEPTK
jgi:D-xylose transport system ATP-binding protein